MPGGQDIPKQDKPKQEKKEAKLADIKKTTIEDMESLKANIFNMRDHTQSLIGQAIRVSDAFRRFHYVKQMGGDTVKRTEEQDKRIQARAQEDWIDSAKTSLMYIERLEEEIRAAVKTLRG